MSFLGISLLIFVFLGIIRPLFAMMEGIAEAKRDAAIKFGPSRARMAEKLRQMEEREIAWRTRMQTAAEEQSQMQSEQVQDKDQRFDFLHKAITRPVTPEADPDPGETYRNPVKGRIQQRKKS